MVAAGFAWFATRVSASDDDLLFTIGIALDGALPGDHRPPAAGVPERAAADPRRAAASPARATSPSPCCRSRRCCSRSRASREPARCVERRPVAVGRARRDAVRRSRSRSSSPRASRSSSGAALTRRRRSGARSRRCCGRAAPRSRRSCWRTGSTPPPATRVGRARPARRALLVATIPFGFLVGLLRSRLAHAEAAVGADRARSARRRARAPLRAALADALGDPSLALAYWLPESERFVDALGHPVDGVGTGLDRGRAARPPDRRDRARPVAVRGAAAGPHGRRRGGAGAREPAPGGRAARRGSRSCARRAPASSRPATPSAGGSSATCTTAPSRAWSRSP